MDEATKKRKAYLEHLALILENEGKFYAAFNVRKPRGMAYRDQISIHENRVRNTDEQTLGMGDKTNADEREILRRYFFEKWSMTPIQPDCERERRDLPYQLYEQEPKVVSAPEKLDYTTLPDGTLLHSSNGKVFIKGPLPESAMNKGVTKSSIEEAALGMLVGYTLDSSGAFESWNFWDKHGKGSLTYIVKHSPAKKPKTNYFDLPDGTILRTKGRGNYVKGIPNDSVHHPHNVISQMVKRREKGQVVGYSVGGGWVNWTAHGTVGDSNAHPDWELVDHLLVAPAEPTPEQKRALHDAQMAAAWYDLRNKTNPPIDVKALKADAAAAFNRDDRVDAFASYNLGDVAQTLNQTKEDTTMNTITITTKTLVNGIDITTMSKAAIYDLIANQEKKIAELDDIKNKPKSLKKELLDRQAGIDALVAHLDKADDSADAK